ncbi:MAG: hypothetical protein UY97_C0004G0036 [Parcubacteria group bacterium GW2011_GWB1_57_6]|nr:MAG: hypothetical protein UY93_C0002G0471 [Parcubacteria group bacterium GW2011_GWA1_56_13]KKW46647.1 MAG: hypothetical protein UY97_C0004G0036 [Parcubacteria group bacterium GW2011_GWB1_57_6]
MAMVRLDPDCEARGMGRVLLAMFIAEARWLADFISKKKEDGQKIPEVLHKGYWQGEPDFNRRLRFYRELGLSLWGKVEGDAAAEDIVRGVQIVPFTNIDLNGLHAGLKKLATQTVAGEESASGEQETPPEQRIAA